MSLFLTPSGSTPHTHIYITGQVHYVQEGWKSILSTHIFVKVLGTAFEVEPVKKASPVLFYLLLKSLTRSEMVRKTNSG